MSYWKLFPYAYHYLSKYQYSDEDLSSVYRRLKHVMVPAPTLSEGENIEEQLDRYAIFDGVQTPETFYWEVTFHDISSSQLELTSVGLERASDGVRFGYCGDGSVSGAPAVKGFGSGDVIGCGFTAYGRIVFFTKNGEWITSITQDYQRWTCPYISSNGEPSARAATNFGESPFQFDIKTYGGRAYQLARILPAELIHLIVNQAFCTASPVTVTTCRTIYRLARVCRQWHDLSQRVRCSQISIHSDSQRVAFTGIRLWAGAEVLVTQEATSGKPWLHKFLARPSLRPPVARRWICDHRNTDLRCPSHVPLDLGMLVRSSKWDGLRHLELRHRKFKTWTKFAVLVSSLPGLESLKATDVTWDNADSITLPPSWLNRKCRHRLRTIVWGPVTHPAGNNCIGQNLWLFGGKRTLQGRPYGMNPHPDDVPIISRILAAITQVGTPGTDQIRCTATDHSTYFLTAYHGSLVVKSVEFVITEGEDGYSRLTKVNLRAGPNHFVSLESELTSTIASLSNGADGAAEILAISRYIQIEWDVSTRQYHAPITQARYEDNDLWSWYEHHVQTYAAIHLPEANRAMIRKVLYCHTVSETYDGPEHVIVTFMGQGGNLGTHHIHREGNCRQCGLERYLPRK